jgi:Domain of unknown function (DUF4383)
MSLKQIAIIFGVVFVIVGACGWVPAANPGGKLLGLFDVNPAHNFVHLATGIVAIIAGVSGEKVSRIFFQIFGVIYGLVAVLGFYYGAISRCWASSPTTPQTRCCTSSSPSSRSTSVSA